MDDDFIKAGVVYVDAGCVAVGDPSYLDQVEDWSDEALKMDMRQQFGEYGKAGVLVSSGLGDGAYEVFVRYTDIPGWGRRVAELRVVFIEDADKSAAFMDEIVAAQAERMTK